MYLPSIYVRQIKRCSKYSLLMYLALSGCSIACIQHIGTVRDFETVPFPIEWEATPDKFNVSGYVLAQIVCPRAAMCIRAEAVIVGNTPTSNVAEGFEISTDCPTWFKVGKSYRFSMVKGKGLVAYSGN